ncbi:MAG: ketopantoate reductase family protein [Candidatus Kariarchaeaceae archaeon]
MNILIAGAGSIGTVVGTLLAETHDVTLLRRSGVSEPQKIESTIIGAYTTKREVTITKLENLENSFDVIYIACQSQDTDQLCQDLRKIVANHTILVSLQNGIQNGNTIRRFFPNNPLILASIWWGATLIDQETVHYRSVDLTKIGVMSKDKEINLYQNELDLIHNQLRSLPSGSFNCEISSSMEEVMYHKLVYNILAPTAALVKSIDLCFKLDETRKLSHYLFDEALEIVSQHGINVDVDRLTQAHKFLKSKPQILTEESEQTNDHPSPKVGLFKTSTQISTEKYGGKGSNVGFLLGELEELAKINSMPCNFINEVKKTIESFPPNYDALSIEQISELLDSNPSPFCRLSD